MRAARSIAVAWLAAAAGCSGSAQATIQILGSGDPTSVSINVFDGWGRIGHSDVAPAHLPGRVTVSGLPDDAGELRIVAIGSAPTGQTLGGARVTVHPGELLNALITLAVDTPDGDADQVPDNLDDCPATANPLQENAAGSGAGDACRPIASDGGADLATPPPPGSDLAMLPPDMSHSASLCATAGVPFCDGFESATLDAHWGPPVQVNGNFSIDTSKAYRGSSSLHLHSNMLAANGNSDVELFETQSFPSTHLWVRAFVLLPIGFSTDDADLIFMEQDANPYNGILLGVQGASFHTTNTITGGRKTSTTAMPRDQWVCLEWEVQLGASGTTALSVNGVAANSLGGTQNLAPTPAIAQLGLSLIATAGSASTIAARDVWFDEIIVDSQPIGCTK